MKPFHKIKVLDLTHVLAGPFCTYQLAVLGADVIKIESGEDPDMMRSVGPDSLLAEQRMGIHFLSQSAGKKALGVDLKTKAGVEVLKRMVETADVFVENFRTGVMEQLGLGYEELSDINPRLVYCSLTGFGHTGPKAKHPAYDNVIQAYSGMMDCTGTPESGPIKVGPPVLDYGTGAQAALAVAAALYQRTNTGVGQRIDIAMLDAALMLMSSSVVETSAGSTGSVVRSGNSSASNAGYGCFSAKEDLIMVGAYTNKQLTKLWQVLGVPDRASELQTQDYKEVASAIKSDRKKLAEIFITESAGHWETILNNAGVPAARVRTLKEAIHSDQVKSRRVLQEVSHPLDPTMQLSVPVAAYDFKVSGPSVEDPPPFPGQHTESILKELGYSGPEISELLLSGVVQRSDSIDCD